LIDSFSSFFGQKQGHLSIFINSQLEPGAAWENLIYCLPLATPRPLRPGFCGLYGPQSGDKPLRYPPWATLAFSVKPLLHLKSKMQVHSPSSLDLGSKNKAAHFDKKLLKHSSGHFWQYKVYSLVMHLGFEVWVSLGSGNSCV